MSYDILPKAKLQYLLTRLKEVFDGMVQGHTIKNNTGTLMTTRTSVQFGGYLKTTDDSANNKTIIDDSPIEITWADYQALTDVQRANNKYLITDYPSSGIEITDVGVPSTASVGQVPTVRNVGGSLKFVMEDMALDDNDFTISTTWVANADTGDYTTYPYKQVISTALYNNNSSPYAIVLAGTPTNYMSSAELEDKAKLCQEISYSTSGITLLATEPTLNALTLRVRGV